VKRTRGLAAIAGAREDRAQGRVRWTTQAGLMCAVAVAGGLIAYKVVSERELDRGKQALLAKQRAVDATLGAEWYPLRDKVENALLGAAREYGGDRIEPSARRRELRSQPGLYLRMRVADVKDVASIRAAAAESKRDAFAACLLREPNERGIRGEIDGGAFSEQPWNLGRAYAATRILEDEWVRAVREADDELRLRVFREQYDSAVRNEIPLAVDVVKRAQFFLFVLDEDAPEAMAFSDGGHLTEDALQRVDHPARVHILELPTGREILRLRRSGEARVIPAGERVITDPETRDAMQRQANNCALAGSVEQELSWR
jgi:hypothetical protein